VQERYTRDHEVFRDGLAASVAFVQSRCIAPQRHPRQPFTCAGSGPKVKRMRNMPYPAHWSVRQGLDAYLRENGFTREEYDAKWTPASFLGVRFKVPNTAKHRWAIMLHDLHHVATGFGTDLIGEGEISVWEARGGLRPLGLYVGSIVASGTVLAILGAPRRALAALQASRRGKVLWAMNPTYTDLLDMTVGELRSLLGVPQEGLAKLPRERHAHAPREVAF